MGPPGDPTPAAAEGAPAGAGRPLAATVVGFIVFFVAVGAAGVGGMVALSPGVKQPIAFDHGLHAKDNAVDCSTCHADPSLEPFVRLPGAGDCAACHGEPIGKSAEEAKLVRLLRGGKPIAWRPLFAEPRHVFFSHRRHVAVAGIQCETCHGAIAAARSPPEHARRLRMQDCLACHRRSGAATDCTACHR